MPATELIELPSDAEVDWPAARIFDLITDFDSYPKWLGTSSAYHGTSEISSNPMRLGTTYREPGPFGVRHGEVTEFERPTRVTFHQPMTLKFGIGVIDVSVRYALTPRGGKTHVSRVCAIDVPWQLKLLQPVVVEQFRSESARTLAALKAYADKQPR